MRFKMYGAALSWYISIPREISRGEVDAGTDVLVLLSIRQRRTPLVNVCLVKDVGLS